jgi:predicted nucleic acid-binding protein
MRLDTNVLISATVAPSSLRAMILNWGEKNGVVLYSDATLKIKVISDVAVEVKL